jgi:cytochrome d ubiquinol oxidase subunit II
MIALWFGVVSLMLITYVTLDGRNFGAGMLHWFVAKTPQERRQVVAAIGPLWSWHEVWLVGFGGALLAVFPKLMFSVRRVLPAQKLNLWGLILRHRSRSWGHINDRLWQGFWDFVSCRQFPTGDPFQVAAGNLDGRSMTQREFLDGILHGF